MANEPKSSQSFSRWWEFYVVRYAMGTVVGAVIVYSLAKDIPPLKELIGLPLKDFSAEGRTVQVLILAVCGMIYCYIASAPILVFHAGRFLFPMPFRKFISLVRLLVFLLGAAIVVAIGWVLLMAVWPPSLPVPLFFLIGALSGILIGCFQYLVVWRALRSSARLFRSSKKLARNRAVAKGDLVNSYRHLREHGNSFFIVFLEILLGMNLFVLKKFFSGQTRLLVCAVVLVIWIIPAVMVWLVATLFEREFAKANFQG